MKDTREIIDEISSEAAKLYSDYNISIFDAIEIATKIVKVENKGIEIIGG